MDDQQQLADLRHQIDTLDHELLELLARRMAAVKTIGQYKKARTLEPFDPERWQSLLAERLALARSLHLSEKFVTKIYQIIHEYALAIEAEVDAP
jgi:chorismate mutase